MRGMKKMVLVLVAVLSMAMPTSAIYAENTTDVIENTTNQQAEIVVPEGGEYQTENQSEAATFQGSIESGQTNAEVPLKIPYRGQMQIQFSVSNELTQDMTVTIVKNTTGEVVSTMVLTKEQASSVQLVSVKETGKYTLKVETAQTFTPIAFEGSVVMYRDGASRTLTEDTPALAYPTSKNQTILYKFTVKNNGCILIGGKTYQGEKMTIEILNSKKVSLNPRKSVLSESNDYLMNYALKKGTYYIRVTNMKTPYRIRYRYYKHYEQAGTSKAKAVTLTKGKEKKGMFYLTDSTSKENWFKVTLTKKQKLSMIITSYGSSSLEYQLLAADSNVTIRNSKFYPPNGVVRMKTGDTLPKGTYYIKISKSAKENISAIYTIELE